MCIYYCNSAKILLSCGYCCCTWVLCSLLVRWQPSHLSSALLCHVLNEFNHWLWWFCIKHAEVIVHLLTRGLDSFFLRELPRTSWCVCPSSVCLFPKSCVLKMFILSLYWDHCNQWRISANISAACCFSSHHPVDELGWTCQCWLGRGKATLMPWQLGLVGGWGSSHH